MLVWNAISSMVLMTLEVSALCACNSVIAPTISPSRVLAVSSVCWDLPAASAADLEFSRLRCAVVSI